MVGWAKLDLNAA